MEGENWYFTLYALETIPSVLDENSSDDEVEVKLQTQQDAVLTTKILFAKTAERN